MKRSLLVVIFVLALASVAVAPVFASGPLFEGQPVDGQDFESLFLGLVGAVLSLMFRYVPRLKIWFEGFAHQGLVMFGFVVLIGGIYFGLSCSPYAEMLQIAVTCNEHGAVELVKTVFAIAAGNQLAYLYLPAAA